MRQFKSGATRDEDKDKIDPEGFLSPWAIERYCQYMHAHRIQTDGTMRDSDNWTKGIPRTAYMKSMWRHLLGVWKAHRGAMDHAGLEDSLCGVIFNAMGYLHELVKVRQSDHPPVLPAGETEESDHPLVKRTPSAPEWIDTHDSWISKSSIVIPSR